MSRQGIERMDKIAFDSMKLPLQLDDSPPAPMSAFGGKADISLTLPNVCF